VVKKLRRKNTPIENTRINEVLITKVISMDNISYDPNILGRHNKLRYKISTINFLP
jgi:hypothetical protein